MSRRYTVSSAVSVSRRSLLAGAAAASVAAPIASLLTAPAVLAAPSVPRSDSKFKVGVAIQQTATEELSAWDGWRDWTVGADPQVHVDNIHKWWDAGVNEVWVHSGQQDQLRVIDFYGKEVLPRLAR